MNHSLYVILEFVALFYKMSTEEVTSESQKQEIVKARKMIILLAQGHADGRVARFLGLNRTSIVNHRKYFLQEMEFNKILKQEYLTMKHDLLYYEIDEVFIRKNYLSLS